MMRVKLSVVFALLPVMFAGTVYAASISLYRADREVTPGEIAAGAPAGGIVHDFYVNADTDILSISRVGIDAPLYQNVLGSDVALPSPAIVNLDPALAVDSFIRTPGQTATAGGGFDGSPGDHAWFDTSNDGQQQDFLFARLTTVGRGGTFSGAINVRGANTFVPLQFNFSLPADAAGLASLGSEPSYSLTYSTTAPPPIVTLPPYQPPHLPPTGTSQQPPIMPPVGNPVPPEPPLAGPGAHPTPASLASFTITREVRAVTNDEIVGGAAPGSFVNDFFITTPADLLSVGFVNIDAPLFQHALGSDQSPANPALAATTTGLSADSYIAMPGSTGIAGGGFGSPDSAWFDTSNDGAQQNFHFAHLTTDQAGTFAGKIGIRTLDGLTAVPFSFTLAVSTGDAALIAAQPSTSYSYVNHVLPPIQPPAPTPPPFQGPQPPVVSDPPPQVAPPVDVDPAIPPVADPPADLPLATDPPPADPGQPASNPDQPQIVPDQPDGLPLITTGEIFRIDPTAFMPVDIDHRFLIDPVDLRILRAIDLSSAELSIDQSGIIAFDSASIRITDSAMLLNSVQGVANDSSSVSPRIAASIAKLAAARGFLSFSADSIIIPEPAPLALLLTAAFAVTPLTRRVKRTA